MKPVWKFIYSILFHGVTFVGLSAVAGAGCSRSAGDILPELFLLDALVPPEYSVHVELENYYGDSLSIENKPVFVHTMSSGSEREELLIPAGTSAGTFSQRFHSTDQYQAGVWIYPSNPTQFCRIKDGSESGTIENNNIYLKYTCVGAYRTSGAITNLQGSGLRISKQSSSETLEVASTDSSYEFRVPDELGSDYSLSIDAQPTNPWQTCNFTSSSSTAVTGSSYTGNLLDQPIDCTTNTYNLGVAFQDVNYTGLVLTYEATDYPINPPADPLDFGPKASGSSYNITIKAQPVGSTCSIFGGSGTIENQDVTATVQCTNTGYPIGGSISPAAAGDGLTLRKTVNSVTEEITLAGGATSYSFPTALNLGEDYTVDIVTQPSSPTGSCVFTPGGGTSVSGNADGSGAITLDPIECKNYYSVSVTVQGLGVSAGDAVTLNITGTELSVAPDPLHYTTNTSQTFGAQVLEGTAFALSNNPTLTQYCTFTQWGTDETYSATISSATSLNLYCRNIYKRIAMGGAIMEGASTNRDHALAIRGDGTLWAWGSNNSDQLGLGNTPEDQCFAYHTTSKYCAIPTQVGTDSDWKAVSAGDMFSVATKNDGTLWTWGYNGSGQLGHGHTTNLTIPTQVGAATDWVKISAGDSHVHAIRTDAQIWSWGWGTDGQLGNGSSTSSALPVKISTIINCTEVAAGGAHGIAMCNGNLYGWGQGDSGQNGRDFSSTYSPYQIASTVTYNGLSAGRDFSLALEGGKLLTWGSNTKGQMGVGLNQLITECTGTYRANPEACSQPTYVTGHSDWFQVDAGSDHVLGVNTPKNALRAWGSNFDSKLGFGSNPSSVCSGNYSASTCHYPSASPTVYTGWVSVAAGVNASLALTEDGFILGWGSDGVGQMGDGNLTDDSRTVPKPVW